MHENKKGNKLDTHGSIIFKEKTSVNSKKGRWLMMEKLLTQNKMKESQQHSEEYEELVMRSIKINNGVHLKGPKNMESNKEFPP